MLGRGVDGGDGRNGAMTGSVGQKPRLDDLQRSVDVTCSCCVDCSARCSKTIECNCDHATGIHDVTKIVAA